MAIMLVGRPTSQIQSRQVYKQRNSNNSGQTEIRNKSRVVNMLSKSIQYSTDNQETLKEQKLKKQNKKKETKKKLKKQSTEKFLKIDNI